MNSAIEEHLDGVVKMKMGGWLVCEETRRATDAEGNITLQMQVRIRRWHPVFWWMCVRTSWRAGKELGAPLHRRIWGVWYMIFKGGKQLERCYATESASAEGEDK